ncbi:MAG: flagellin, partial [Defluviitaleaceae bacterium]|nr:flagellin [Defluviitaleaceae bacterium]
SAMAAISTLRAKNSSLTPLWFQLGANANQGVVVNIGRIKSDVMGIGNGDGVSYINLISASGISPFSSPKSIAANSGSAWTAPSVTGWLDTLDVALTYVTTERAKLGAIQNRLEYTMKSLDISSENLSDSESRVRNADMAKEMMTFTKSSVLQQAAVSMLAQANMLPQNLLQLLR